MPSRRMLLLIAVLTVLFLFAGCAAEQLPMSRPSAPGFGLGFWHGLIAPVTFLVSLFNEHVRIYAFPNAGRWYDFGFMLGIGGFSGGLFAGSRRGTRT